MRLDKYLCDCGIGTRSEVKNYISKGRVKVEFSGDCQNKEEHTAITKLKPEFAVTDDMTIFFDGEPVVYEQFRYYVLNKPAGYITATEDSKDPVVMELLKGVNLKGLSPVGRLDKDTEGLLLITDDGQLNHNLLSPKKHVDKTYYLRTDVKIPLTAVELFETGVDIGDEKMTMPAKLEILEAGLSARLTIQEGRFHQVKRMMEAVGCTVVYLKRESFGKLTLVDSVLGELAIGEFRKITREEIL